MHVAARKLFDMLYHLEIKAGKGELESPETLFTDILTEFDKLKSFLSQPNWLETVEEHTHEEEKMKEGIGDFLNLSNNSQHVS